MNAELLKKVCASFFAGGMLLTTMPTMTAYCGIPAEQEYSVTEVQEHNAAIPLALGTLKRSESFGDKISANFGYDFLMVRNADLERLRPDFCEALLEYSRKVRYGVVKTLEQFDEMASMLSTPEKVPYTVFESIEVRRADARTVSLLGIGSSYTGGIHGMYGVQGTNFNSVTGAVLTLNDVCRDIPQFIDIVDAKIDQQYAGASMFDKEKRFAKLKNNNGSDINWILGNEGITVYFNPYEIASYADGIISVTVPFAGNEEIFDSYYTKVPDAYALIVNQPLDYGFKADSSFKRLSFFASAEDNGKTPIIIIGNNRLNDTSVSADELSPLFIHLDGVGEDYLYVFIRQADNYQLNVYRVTGNIPEKAGEIIGIRRAVDAWDFDFVELGTKPEAMLLERVKADGSYARGLYTVGADGMPVILQEMK